MHADRQSTLAVLDEPQPPTSLDEALALLAAQQQRFMQLKVSHEGFVRAVSHDLRAPLRHLTSFAPLLRESVETLAQATPGEAADEAQEFLLTMEQSARKMGLMLDALMQLSRAAQQPLDLQPVDVRTVLLSCAERIQPALNTLAWSLPSEPALLRADPAALHAVLSELLGNAAKFRAVQVQPRVQVDVTTAAPAAGDASSQALWRIAITDHGVGFDSTRMSPAWPPFQRMHRDSDFAGVGCGLALAHQFAVRHGATLQLQSRPSEGCTAVLEWPAAS